MAVAQETLTALGWPHGYVLMIGLIELAGTVLYVIPATSLLGAIIMTGLFGGAIATQVRAEVRSSRISSSASILPPSCGAGCGCAMPAFAPFCRSSARRVEIDGAEPSLTTQSLMIPLFQGLDRCYMAGP